MESHSDCIREIRVIRVPLKISRRNFLWTTSILLPIFFFWTSANPNCATILKFSTALVLFYNMFLIEIIGPTQTARTSVEMRAVYSLILCYQVEGLEEQCAFYPVYCDTSEVTYEDYP